MSKITDSILTVLPKTKDTIIEDPVLEPYFIINYVEGGWGVCMKRLSGKGELKYREICFPTKFESCLNEVAKAKLHNQSKHYTSIHQYIEDWREVSNQILDAHKAWNIPEI